MPQQDFQSALAEFGRRAQALAATDPAFDEARLAAHALVVATGVQLTDNTRMALVCLAGALAVRLQDYAQDSLATIVHATPAETWAMLPSPIQELLDTLWPDEGGLTFLGKIGIAVVSEGFTYPN
jgi:hypothetical protein